MAHSKISREDYERIRQILADRGSLPKEAIEELVNPIYDFDPVLARKREVGRYVSGLISRMRDENGARNVFLEKRHSQAVNVDTCKDVEQLTMLLGQLESQAKGLNRSLQKVKRRCRELKGQVSMFETATM